MSTMTIGQFSKAVGIPSYTLRKMCHSGIVKYDRTSSSAMSKFIFDDSCIEETKRAVENNKNTKNRRTCRKYSLNESFFENLNEKSAYILGYTWADGCLFNFRGSWGLLFECQSKDVEILLSIKEAMGSNAPIKTRKRISPSTGNEFEMSKLSIYSNKIANDLMKYGVIPGKSKKDPLPLNIPNDLVLHFIRGAFDGDGCVMKTHEDRRLSWILSGKKSFLEWVDKKLTGILNIKSQHIHLSFPTHLTRSDSWKIIYSRQQDIQTIQFALYNKAEIALSRKKLFVIAA